ncbi:aldose 1-epimerase [Limoniibacter endophyticus]|uniref:Aldose 1-epimerase n=1 Tax=Limoniibacter endophyticus TaxID=1565040 RepID=A0A8J3DU63_9HYPH|nr:aldose 1-epimerase [Limoniibacter endophyticus]GHC76978.1 aldose 1-epimerase [Limoniibacter endophyticus]
MLASSAEFLLKGGGYSLAINPSQGGWITALDWECPEGAKVNVLEPAKSGAPPFKAGCFPMLPFTNRIADGRFMFAGHIHAMPVNRAEEHVAIHGHGRDHPWTVLRLSDAEIVLEQLFDHAASPYVYRAAQSISLGEGGVQIEISVQNSGSKPLPFGVGLHPWFTSTARSSLTFSAEGTFEKDERGLPRGELKPQGRFAGPEERIADHAGFDGCFMNWHEGRATIFLPEMETRVDIEAGGDFCHLHVYVPVGRDVVCVEPVSHLPDAINRPGLGSGAMMRVLFPGQSLAGTMHISASFLRKCEADKNEA